MENLENNENLAKISQSQNIKDQKQNKFFSYEQ